MFLIEYSVVSSTTICGSVPPSYVLPGNSRYVIGSPFVVVAGAGITCVSLKLQSLLKPKFRSSSASKLSKYNVVTSKNKTLTSSLNNDVVVPAICFFYVGLPVGDVLSNLVRTPIGLDYLNGKLPVWLSFDSDEHDQLISE